VTHPGKLMTQSEDGVVLSEDAMAQSGNISTQSRDLRIHSLEEI
jgi:hypothetical protein